MSASATGQRTHASATAAPARAPHVNRSAKPRPDAAARMVENKRGNQAMQALLLGGLVQGKLTVSAPTDPLERDADAVADRVMGARIGSNPLVQRQCAACAMDTLDRKASATETPRIDDALPAQVASLRGGGAPLSESARDFFEPRFGQDFSAVRVHTGAHAAQTASSINALAYTRGRDIVFAQGQYQPESFAGRKLLAHELTHVVQQGEGAGRNLAANTVQRACGPDQIDNAEGCEFPTSDPAIGPDPEPVGELLRFNVNCDTFVSVDEWQKARTFADSMLATDVVRIHGFASMDGDATFNLNLSCERAKMAAHALRGGGIADHQMEIIAHGATPGPADERRSAVLELDAPFSRQPTPQLTGSVLTHPEPGPCGDVYYELMWDISRPADLVSGGFVVQQVTVTRTEEDCAGIEIPWINTHPTRSYTSPLVYYEAWRVNPGAHSFDRTDDDTDEFTQFRFPTIPATGSMTWTAVATYYDGVATLPTHMTRRNLLTLAGTLRSSLQDPMLAGTASRPVRHELSITWDCCPDQSFPTSIDHYTPR